MVKLLVGLGNPGVRYAATRHNVGFRVAEALAARRRIRLKAWSERAVVGQGVLNGDELWVAEPLGFMNRSGAVVKDLLAGAAAGPDALVVVYDDLDLPLGQLRFKRKGGHGGHNGLRSIIDSLGTDAFLRLKVGVGRPPPGRDPVDYVLEAFLPSEEGAVASSVTQACDALEVALTEGVDVAMNRFHVA